MKNLLLFMAFLLLSSTSLMAQAQSTASPATGCECEGGISEMQVYYFSDLDADIDVYSDPALSNLIASFPNQTSGDLLNVQATGLADGTFGYYLYFHINYANGDDCITRIFSLCPTNAWPGALGDLQILGKAFGDLTPFAYTSAENDIKCTVSNIDQDWHVGGNILAPDNTRLGTRNNESVSFITNDTEKAVLTNDGSLGLGVNPPEALLDVNGDTRIAETLDIFGITTIHNNTSSGTADDGALIVEGGIGIGENVNIGSNLDVNGTATVGNNFTVEATGTANILNTAQSTGPTSGALVVDGGVGIGENASIGSNLDVNGTATVGNNFTVEATGTANILNTAQSTSPTSGALVVDGGVGVGSNLHIGENLNVAIDADISGITRIGTMNAPFSIGGEITSDYHLFVAGGILTEEVLVRTGWADYVFENKYQLRSLKEVESYIQSNGHLPDVPAAAEVENNGLKLGANAVTQQVKIEEIFLYLIEMDKEIEALQKENELLKAKIDEVNRQ